jgi:two-component system chemotaxis response regulator CheB
MNRLMIVDDALIMRMRIRIRIRIREVATLAGWTVVAEAANGNEAVRLFNELQPDLVTLDMVMPDINGIDVLMELKRRRIRTNVVMISRLTAAGAQVTTDAMIEGAFDFILKPSGSSPSENKNTLRIALLEKIAALADARSGLASDVLGSPPPPRQTAPVVKPEAIVIACSTGGPDALSHVIPDLSATLPVPVFIIQHMPPRFTASLASRLNDASELHVLEAEDGLVEKPGHAFVARGGQHLLLERRHSEQIRLTLTDAPPEQNCRPAADDTLRSAVDVYRGHLLAFILTGMGRDGTAGC